ncbi:MAG TPA: hypothetical protein DHV49_00015 [Alphaproteobacteria bacterium]|nr:hypothetical protein [Alphaproteobacteria bacterium]
MTQKSQTQILGCISLPAGPCQKHVWWRASNMFEEIGALNLARIQFAFTVSAHIIFPALIIRWVLPC